MTGLRASGVSGSREVPGLTSGEAEAIVLKLGASDHSNSVLALSLGVGAASLIGPTENKTLYSRW